MAVLLGIWKVVKVLLIIAAALYALLFVVFFFDLDGKLIFKVVEPALVKRYDKMERKNPLDQPYDIDKPNYEYKV